jgi:hypothetical protein
MKYSIVIFMALTLAVSLAGCRDEGGNEDTDVGHDPQPDPDADAEADTPHEVPPDVTPDTPDVTPDNPPDVTPDNPPDVTPDNEDTPPDVTPDGEDTPTDEVPACDTIAALRAAADGAVDMDLCNVMVTYVYANGYFIQAGATGPGIQVYEGSTWTADVAAGDELNLHVTSVTTYHGTKEIDAHDAVTKVSTGNDITTLEQNLTTLSLAPSEDLESELVRVTGATVVSVTGPDLLINYGTLTNIPARVGNPALLCTGAVFSVLCVVTEWETQHRIQSFNDSDLYDINTSACTGSALAGDLLINEFLADPPDGPAPSGDANCDGTRDGSEDEFVEIVNVSTAAVTLEGITISDGASLRHTFAAGVILQPGKAVVVYGGGTPSCTVPSDVMVLTASTGQIGLNNAGDTITIADSMGNTIVAYTYGGEGGNNESLTLNPDLNDTDASETGIAGFGGHIAADTADGSPYSPGTRINGTAF